MSVILLWWSIVFLWWKALEWYVGHHIGLARREEEADRQIWKHSSVPTLNMVGSKYPGVPITRVINRNNPHCATLGQAQASKNQPVAIIYWPIQDRWEITEAQICMGTAKFKNLNKSRDSIRIRANGIMEIRVAAHNKVRCALYVHQPAGKQ